MIQRSFLLPALLLCLAPAAQNYTGTGSPLVNPLAVFPGLSAADFGASHLEGITRVVLDAQKTFIGVCGPRTPTSPSRASAWVYDSATRQLTARSDLDQITRDGDSLVTLTEDLRTAVFFLNGLGLRLTKRDAALGPWSPRIAVSGLTPGAHSPKWVMKNGVLKLLTVDPPPTNTIRISNVDLDTGQASNSQVIAGPPLGGTLSIVKSVTPIACPRTREVRGLAAIEGTIVGFQQRMYVTPGVDGARPWYPLFDRTDNNIVADMCQWSGGTIAAAGIRALPNAPLPSGVWSIEGVFTFDREFQTPGRIDLSMLTPASGSPFAATLAIGTLGTAGIPVPGFLGELALNPVGMLFLPARQTSGAAEWSFDVPPIIGTVTVQGVAVRPGNYVLGASAGLVLR
jgi:hypothetical protein